MGCFIRKRNEKNPIVIGFDPATITGYAILEIKPKKIQIAEVGIIEVSKPLGAGLVGYSNTIRDLLYRWKPTFIVCEELNYARNTQTVKFLSELKGIIRLEAYKHNACELSFFTATEARKRIGARGNATKSQTASFLQEYFENDRDVNWNDDNITDAIAIGLAMVMEVKSKGGN